METAERISSETTDGKQIIRFAGKTGRVNYVVKIVLSADGNGEEDVCNKLKALLKNELRRQLKD